ncbi:branched-chain-amino-acid transaminase [Methylobacter sp. BlB1]|uniref:branched-chain-amino-acid transaminase n=1 Tax=Methylobacter sp. BlB1 TaxID=2785914 RepID=UPI001893E580|nr:branched-chain-amino-acid transaminase [Methylobacter sp. BlB1]MBF6647920.1 branched-chain-amino-acid transaminase [Methylobacter sp. BlB1]
MSEQALCWLNGQLLPLADASVPVNDHGLLYGDGVFEGIRIYHKRAFRLQQHLERLALSARAIALDMPYSLAELMAAVEETVEVFSHESGYIRLMVTRGPGPLGLNPVGCHRPNVIIIADQISLVHSQSRDQGARLIIAATRRLPFDGLDPRIKSLNYLNHILAKIEANHAGVDEAVLLNGLGRVTEGTADNIFIVKNETLVTPPCTEGALEGITRELILELAAEAGISVQIAPLAPYDLYTADECFLTGTGAEMIPVKDIDGRGLTKCPGPVFKQLNRLFFECIETESR